MCNKDGGLKVEMFAKRAQIVEIDDLLHNNVLKTRSVKIFHKRKVLIKQKYLQNGLKTDLELKINEMSILKCFDKMSSGKRKLFQLLS